MIVAFTGHRFVEASMDTEDRVKKALRETLLELRPEKAITGMALGTDQWAAEVCLDLDVPYVAAVPCQAQDRYWSYAAKRRYQQLLDGAVEIVVVTKGRYTPEVMARRNAWMVQRCDLLLAVFDGSPGGTANCVRYATEVGRPIRRVVW